MNEVKKLRESNKELLNVVNELIKKNTYKDHPKINAISSEDYSEVFSNKLNEEELEDRENSRFLQEQWGKSI